MTRFNNAVVLGDPPAARLTPPMASSAMKAPTAAVAPFRTLRRVAPPSPAGVVVPLLTIRWCTPPSRSPACDHDALDQQPDEGKTPESQNVRADTGWQDITDAVARCGRDGRRCAR